MCTQPLHMRIDRRVVRVPCGHCDDCNNHRSTRNAVLAQLEAQHHKYVLFVNPSYDMESVPVARVEYSPHRVGHVMSVYNDSKRMCKDYESTNQLIYQRIINHDEKKKIDTLFRDNKFRYFGKNRFPYTSSREVQRFIKRLRYYIYTDQTVPFDERRQVRYFAAYEYGPQSFRPHMHVLLFTNSETIFKQAGYYISKAWTFGRCPWSLSRGSCAQYAAEYTTANSVLPSLLSHRSISPRSLHSIGLGKEKDSILSLPLEQIQYSKIAVRMFTDGSKLKYISPSFSVEPSLFPKCFRYAQTTHIQRFNCYTLLSIARRLFGDALTIRQLARKFVVCYRHLPTCDKTYLSWMYQPSPDGRSSTEETFVSILNTSSLFLRNCFLLGITPDEYLTNIEQYYIDKEKDTLKKWYTIREQRDLPPQQVIYDYDNLDFNDEVLDYFRSRGTQPLPFFPEFHPECICYLAKTAGFSHPATMLRTWKDSYYSSSNIELTNKKSSAHRLARMRLKHKELNDANHIYEYKQ